MYEKELIINPELGPRDKRIFDEKESNNYSTNERIKQVIR